jgi:hypothetical protein
MVQSFTVTIAPSCVISGSLAPNVADAQLIVNEVLGLSPAVNDLSNDGVVNIVDLQTEINAALNLGCTAR